MSENKWHGSGRNAVSQYPIENRNPFTGFGHEKEEKKKKKRRGVFWWFLLGLMIFIGASVLYYHTSGHQLRWGGQEKAASAGAATSTGNGSASNSDLGSSTVESATTAVDLSGEPAAPDESLMSDLSSPAASVHDNAITTQPAAETPSAGEDIHYAGDAAASNPRHRISDPHSVTASRESIDVAPDELDLIISFDPGPSDVASSGSLMGAEDEGFTSDKKSSFPSPEIQQAMERDPDSGPQIMVGHIQLEKTGQACATGSSVGLF